MTENISASMGTALFSAAEIGGIVGGACRGDLEAVVSSVAVDSRKAGPGTLFVALKGERSDGHDYIGTAFALGATCALASFARKESALAALGEPRSASASGTCVILVDDTLAALQALAREHRRRMTGLTRIGITGSSGKTTTKECLGAALAPCYPAGALIMNEGNLNSDIGLPLSLFALKPHHRIGIFEMGMNRRGEMEELAKVFEPDLAVITNVGTAHIGMIGSREGIADEKKQIFSRFGGSQLGFVWEDDPYRERLSRGVRGRIIAFGTKTTKGLGKIESRGLAGWDIGWMGGEFRFPLPGRHNLLNGLAALSVAAELGVDSEKARSGLASVKPLFGRSELFPGRISLLQDCYNANPDSMDAALDFCDSLEWKGRKVYILGGMRELGDESEEAHRALGRRASRSGATEVIFFGRETEAAAQAARESEGPRPRVRQTNDMDELIRMTIETISEGDLLLLKASRGLELEHLSDALFARGLVDRPGDNSQEAGHAS